MLVVAKGKSLKDFKEYGFKPRYDVDTGEIDEIYCYVYDHWFSDSRWGCYELCITNKEKKVKIFKRGEKTKKEFRKLLGFKPPKYNIDHSIAFDKIYELIKAGLIERV